MWVLYASKGKRRKKKNGGKRLTGGCELWFKHSEPKKILMEKLALLKEKFVRSNGAIKKGLVQVGAGSLGKLKN